MSPSDKRKVMLRLAVSNNGVVLDNMSIYLFIRKIV